MQRSALARVAAKTPEEVAEETRRMRAAISPDVARNTGFRMAMSLTPEQRSAKASKAGIASNAKLTPEQQREKMRVAREAMTPEQNQERERKAAEAVRAISPEKRQEATRKRLKTTTAAERSDSALKAWATRRKNRSA